MFRRVFAILFTLVSLTAQVSTTYACGMMGGAQVVRKVCCCQPDRVGPPCDRTSGNIAVGMNGGGGCCEKVVDIQQGVGQAAAGIQVETRLPDYNPQPLAPALVPVLLSRLLPSTNGLELGWNEVRDTGPHGTDLYLLTQRLRL